MYSPPTVSSTSSHLYLLLLLLLHFSTCLRLTCMKKSILLKKQNHWMLDCFLVFLLLSVSFSPLSFHIPSLNGMTQKQASTLCLLIVEGFVLERKCEKKKHLAQNELEAVLTCPAVHDHLQSTVYCCP